jgi:hypothetical protein
VTAFCTVVVCFGTKHKHPTNRLQVSIQVTVTLAEHHQQFNNNNNNINSNDHYYTTTKRNTTHTDSDSKTTLPTKSDPHDNSIIIIITLIVMTTIIPQQGEIQPILIPIRKQLYQPNPIHTKLPSTQSDTNSVDDVSEWAMMEMNGGERIAPSSVSAMSLSDIANGW